MEEDQKQDQEQEQEHSLLVVINTQIDYLYYLKDVDFSDLYDKAEEDKIKCVESCFEVIFAANQVLMEQIKNL